MSDYLPPGCIDPSDSDYYERINPPRQCPGCKQAEEDCECPCYIEREIEDALLSYWRERSELFNV